MRGSGRRAALIALLAAAVAVIGVHVWFDVVPTIDSDDVTVVSAEGTVDVAGQQLALRSVRADEFAAPEDAHTVSIRLHSRGGAEATGCRSLLLAEQNGERVWTLANSELDIPSDAGESRCQAESPPYDLIAVFVVPDDASGPFWFDVTDEDGRIVRFPVEL
ncbi:hypothetical protein [Microbacterium sp. GXF0217]